MSKYSIVAPEVREIALSHAKGCYQAAVICGEEALSGATLRGKAASYGVHYARSRRNLLRRLRADKRLVVGEIRAEHGRRVLTISAR